VCWKTAGVRSPKWRNRRPMCRPSTTDKSCNFLMQDIFWRLEASMAKIGSLL
jgi:hypothetical protein